MNDNRQTKKIWDAIIRIEDDMGVLNCRKTKNRQDRGQRLRSVVEVSVLSR